MTFNKSHLSDAPGEVGDYARTYTYTVKEVEPTTGAIDKLRYSKAEYQVAVTVKAELNGAGKYTGLITSTTVTQMKDDMGNALGENGRGIEVPSAGAGPTAIPASTFTNTYSTTLPLSGMSGVTPTYLAGAAVLCAAAAGCTFVARRVRREASVVNKKVCSFPILFALLALLIGTCAVVFPASAQAAPSATGSITVSGTVARSYDAYQIFSANVIDDSGDAKIATDLAWQATPCAMPCCPCCTAPVCPIPRPPRRKLPSGSTPIPTLRAR